MMLRFGVEAVFRVRWFKRIEMAQKSWMTRKGRMGSREKKK
jgi:hypothetical protein